jgi:hypothetical protein
MARPKSHGPYTPLAANYFLDDAILEAKEHAELLFVRCLSFLATGDTDGFISELQMRHAVGIGLRDVGKRIETLTKVGLLLRVDGGYEVRSYLKWNKSAEEIGRHLRRDRERKARKQEEEEPNSARNPDGIRADSADHVTALHVTALHDKQILLSGDESPDEEGTLIPADWHPNQGHRDKAASLHLDPDVQAQRFAEHAKRTMRRLKNWNTGFTNWLRKQAEYAQQRQGTSPAPAYQRRTKTQQAFDVLEMGRELLNEQRAVEQ